MIYTFFSSVFITLFFVVGALALMSFLEMMRKYMPLTWPYFKHVVVLAVIAFVFLILAVVFGIQIPECYV